jgi:FHA domain
MNEQTAWPAATRTGLVGVLVEPGPRGTGRLLATVEGEVLLGRDDACPILFLSDRVSRRHARLWCFGPGRFALEDLRSLNGTYVNGQRIVRSCELLDGDHVLLADVELAFRVKPASALPAAQRLPTPGEAGAARGATAPMPPPAALGPMDVVAERPAARRVPVVAFALAVLASLAGAALGHAIGAGRWGALALAVLAPVAVAAVALRGTPRRRIVTTLVVGVLAAALAVAGLTAADVARGRSVLPWAGAGGTFVSAGQLVRLTGSPCADGPAVRLSPASGARTVPVTVNVSCFAPGERIEVRAGAAGGKVLATLTADRQGSAGGRVRLPAATACRAGACTLVVRSADGTHQQVAPYTVTAR